MINAFPSTWNSAVATLGLLMNVVREQELLNNLGQNVRSNLVQPDYRRSDHFRI